MRLISQAPSGEVKDRKDWRYTLIVKADSNRPLALQIKRLFLRKEPLNLTAVKRNHPELLAEVYTVRPFLGWRNALKLAGINYRDINVELLDTCECRICGHEAPILTSHLKIHSLTPKEYRDEFPGAEIMAETIKAARMRAKPRLKHWEPIWSWEYVLDRTWEHYQRGCPINSDDVQKDDKAMFAYVFNSGRRWDEVIEGLGLDPDQIRIMAPAQHLSKAQVIAKLKRRKREGKSLADSMIEREDLVLINAARRRFGSYKIALEAAGLAPESLRPYLKVTDDDINELKDEMLRVAALHGNDRVKAAWALKERFKPIVFRKLGNWRKVCDQFGVPYEDLSVRPYATEAHVIEGLQRWAKVKGAHYKQIYREDRALISASIKRFGTMKKAFAIAGVRLPDARARQVKVVG